MKKPKIIIDDKIPYIKGSLDSVAEVSYLPYPLINRASVCDTDALVIRTRTRCDSQLLGGTNVRLIATATIGTDHIDMRYCSAKGITVRNAPGCNAGSVAQWVTAAICHYMRCSDAARNANTLVGIVGLGNVGSKVRLAAERMGFKVLISDPPLGYMTTLSQLAEQCRIITFHTPLTTDGSYPTLNMADQAFFRKMSPDGFIINAARGGIIDEKALKEWLTLNKEAQCAIDCWVGEPEIDHHLLRMAMIGTPHIAGYSADGKWNGTRMAVKAVNEFFDINGDMPLPLPAVESVAYDIKYDSDLLKHNPERFEWFRGNYRIRRE